MNNNYNIAVSAINLLSDGLTSENQTLDYKIPIYEIGSYQFYDKKSRDEYLLRKIEMDLDYLKSVVSSSDSEIIDDMINDIKMLKT